MSIPQGALDGLVERTAHEGDPRITAGPETSAPAGLPRGWKEALEAPDPREAIAGIWAPFRAQLPRTTMALRAHLKGVALLVTGEFPATLVYLFTNGDRWASYRAWPPGAISHPQAPKLPPDFLRFCGAVHDGWMDFDHYDGPRPSVFWTTYAEQAVTDEVEQDARAHLDPDQFLVVMEEGNTDCFGWDLSKSPAVAINFGPRRPPELVLHPWERLDARLSLDIEDAVRP